MVDRYAKAYKRALSKAQGTTEKNIMKGLSIVAATGLVAATTGAFAGPIAVSIFGSQLAGLSGAALVNACLAAGGGALAVGCGGMAGGVFAIVGGGALPGAAGSSAATLGISALIKSDPDLAISQAVKLTVVIREAILNEGKDADKALKFLEQFMEQIADIQKELTKMKLDKTSDKAAIKNLQKIIDAFERLYRDTMAFVSAFSSSEL